MEPIKCTELIVVRKYQKACYRHIGIKSVSEILDQGNINGIFTIGSLEENDEDFVINLNLNKIASNMEVSIRKDNGKIVDLQALISKADVVLDKDSFVLFELNGTPAKYKANKGIISFE